MGNSVIVVRVSKRAEGGGINSVSSSAIICYENTTKQRSSKNQN